MKSTNIVLSVAALAALTVSFGFSAVAVTDRPAPAGVNQEPMIQVAQAVDLATLMSEGAKLYAANCSPCHADKGQGGAGPKLAGNDFVKSSGAVITQIFQGNEEHGMPPFADALKDREIAAIATYVRNSWGNSSGIVLPDEVTKTR